MLTSVWIINWKRNDCSSNRRGKDGVYKVCQKSTVATKELNQAFVNAGVTSGYGKTEDQNGFKQEGFGPMDMSVDFETGERMTTPNAYLREGYTSPEILQRITIHVGQDVAKLNFDTSSDKNICRGISLIATKRGMTSSEVTTLEPEREVILCAGAVGSPKILELSGIGLCKNEKITTLLLFISKEFFLYTYQSTSSLRVFRFL